MIDVLLVLNLGIIGYRNHAGKLISFLEKNSECEINYIYHPTKSLDDRFTNNFSNLYDCDAVIIASPNKTHYEYIEKLTKNFNGYIFCEKPPVTNNEELIKEKYTGIRPAPGYPACPDHLEKKTIWKILNVENNIGVKLTESMAMWPAASVSGYYFANKEAKYFGLGKINEDQVQNYSLRRKINIDAANKWLNPNINDV